MRYNGWLALYKPRGISSNAAIQQIKKAIGKENKVGHAGTLDPLAEGVLPVAIGEATKTAQYLMDARKEYEFTISFGEERTTGDAEGEVISAGGRIPSSSELQNIIPRFIGSIKQTPPIYSALKIAGQPAYKLARKGVQLALPEREIEIHKLALIGEFTFRVECSKGTYIRSLAVDIARELGSKGYVMHLKRTKVGKILIKDTITLDNLIKIVHNDAAALHLLPVTYGLGDILAIEVDEKAARALKNGLSTFIDNHSFASSQLVQILNEGVLQALAYLEDGLCKPIRVFNL